MNHDYDAVLFDLDGTLTDSAIGIINAIRHALNKTNRPIPDDATLNKFIGPPLIDSFQRYCHLDLHEAEITLTNYREYYAEIGLFENRVYDGVVPMLERLSVAGLNLILATSKPEIFARRILERFDLMRLFNAVHGATLDEKRNKKADIIAWALTHSGTIKHPIMVGDRCHDIEGAIANGIDSIGVLYGYGSNEELRQAGATLIVHTPSEVADIIL